MAVRLVTYDLAVVGYTLVINLPENNATDPGGAQPVTAGCMEHLPEREIAAIYQGTAELTVDRQAFLHHRGRMVERKRLFVKLFTHLPEAWG